MRLAPPLRIPPLSPVTQTAYALVYHSRSLCGDVCSRETFLVCSALSLIEVVAGVILVFRTRHIYKALLQHYKSN